MTDDKPDPGLHVKQATAGRASFVSCWVRVSACKDGAINCEDHQQPASGLPRTHRTNHPTFLPTEQVSAAPILPEGNPNFPSKHTLTPTSGLPRTHRANQPTHLPIERMSAAPSLPGGNVDLPPTRTGIPAKSLRSCSELERFMCALIFIFFCHN